MLYKNFVKDSQHPERQYCDDIFHFLNKTFDNSYSLVVRHYSQSVNYEGFGKFITIIVGNSGHRHIPEEHTLPNCLGVFMHFYPKKSAIFQYDTDNFLVINKVHPLPLGTPKDFTVKNDIPILNRDIDVSYMGQMSDDRNSEFIKYIQIHAQELDNSVFNFYSKWDKGISERYNRVIANSKIVIVPCGISSLDTFKFYEAYKCGCIILSDAQNNYPFMYGSKHIEVVNWSNLAVIVKSLLSGPKHLESNSISNYNFWKNNLSPKAAFNYICGAINV